MISVKRSKKKISSIRSQEYFKIQIKAMITLEISFVWGKKEMQKIQKLETIQD